MNFFTVPINVSLPWQTYNINLSGVVFNLEFRYNGRMDRWIMNVNDASGNQILQGLVLLITRNLTDQYSYLSVPADIFFALDNTGKDSQPGLNSFGVTHTLYSAETA